MTVDPGRPGHLETARRVVQLVGEILAVAAIIRRAELRPRPRSLRPTPGSEGSPSADVRAEAWNRRTRR